MYQTVPIVINYRIFFKIKLFCIDYTINHYCTGLFKYKNQIYEYKQSSPFIDIPLTAFIDDKIKTLNDLFEKHIYENINGICTEKECKNDVSFYVRKFTIVEMPLILSFNINLLITFITQLQKIILYGISNIIILII